MSRSLKTEIAKLRAEVAELIEARRPPSPWLEIVVDPGEDASEKIALALSQNFRVIENQLVNPKPRVLDDDELTPELKLIQAESARAWQQEQEQAEATRKARRKHLRIPESEGKFPLKYPPMKY